MADLPRFFHRAYFCDLIQSVSTRLYTEESYRTVEKTKRCVPPMYPLTAVHMCAGRVGGRYGRAKLHDQTARPNCGRLVGRRWLLRIPLLLPTRFLVGGASASACRGASTTTSTSKLPTRRFPARAAARCCAVGRQRGSVRQCRQ